MNSHIKLFFATLLFFFGVVVASYFGICWAFIGGISDIFEAIRSVDSDPSDVGMGVLKVMFSGLIGWGTAAPFLLTSLVLFDSVQASRGD